MSQHVENITDAHFAVAIDIAWAIRDTIHTVACSLAPVAHDGCTLLRHEHDTAPIDTASPLRWHAAVNIAAGDTPASPLAAFPDTVFLGQLVTVTVNATRARLGVATRRCSAFAAIAKVLAAFEFTHLPRQHVAIVVDAACALGGTSAVNIAAWNALALPITTFGKAVVL